MQKKESHRRVNRTNLGKYTIVDRSFKQQDRYKRMKRSIESYQDFFHNIIENNNVIPNTFEYLNFEVYFSSTQPIFVCISPKEWLTLFPFKCIKRIFRFLRRKWIKSKNSRLCY